MGDSNPHEQHAYRCPHCGVTYTHEHLTRVHITRSDDDDHCNRNGCMPETEIEVVTDDGVIKDTIKKRPEDIDLASLAPADLPDEYTQQHKRIILVAARHPEVESYTELENRAETVLRAHGLETPSYSTIRRVIRQFFRPHLSESQTNTSDTSSSKDRLRDLTERQQAIVIARLAHPDAQATTLADRLGISQSYLSRIYNQDADLIDRLEQRVEAADDLVEVLTDTLTPEGMYTLIDEGYLDDIDVGLTPSLDTSDASPATDEVTDGPVTTQRNVFTATPYTNGQGLTGEQDSPDTDDLAKPTDTDPVPSDAPERQQESHVESDPPKIQRTDLVRLRDCVAFARRIGDHMEHELDWQRALAQVLETELEHLLSEH